MLYNLRFHIFVGKLKFRWSGPFTLHIVSPHGIIEIIDLKSGEEMKGQKPFLTTEPESQNENVMGLFNPFYK